MNPINLTPNSNNKKLRKDDKEASIAEKTTILNKYFPNDITNYILDIDKKEKYDECMDELLFIKDMIQLKHLRICFVCKGILSVIYGNIEYGFFNTFGSIYSCGKCNSSALISPISCIGFAG